VVPLTEVNDTVPGRRFRGINEVTFGGAELKGPQPSQPMCRGLANTGGMDLKFRGVTQVGCRCETDQPVDSNSSHEVI
jgi:hypothetical protein